MPARSLTVVVSLPPSERRSTRSIPSRSIVIAATLRVSRTRPALAENAICSRYVGAVEVELVATALAVDGVAAVARVPLEAVGARAQRCLVRADVAVGEVVAGAADEGLGAGAADQRVVAGAAVHGHVLVRERTAALVDADVVVAAAGLDVDGGEGRPVEAELGAAVRADVRLKRAGRARLRGGARACRSPSRRAASVFPPPRAPSRRPGPGRARSRGLRRRWCRPEGFGRRWSCRSSDGSFRVGEEFELAALGERRADRAGRGGRGFRAVGCRRRNRAIRVRAGSRSASLWAAASARSRCCRSRA